MNRQRNIFLLAGTLVATTAVAANALRSSANAAIESNVIHESSLEEIVPLLNVRREVISTGEVSFSEFKANLAWEDFGELANIVQASQRGVDLSDFDAAQWLGSTEPASLEAWNGRVAAMAGVELEDRERIGGLDTAQATLDAMAAAQGAVARKVFDRVITWSDGAIQKQYRGDRSVVISAHPAEYANNEFAKLDLTALDWSQALNPDRAIPGQQIDVYREDLLYRIVYTDQIEGEEDLKTTYTFDAERDFAPLSVETEQGNAIVQLMIYGYPRQPQTDIHVPSIAVQGVVQQSGLVETRIFEIRDWSLSVDAESVNFQAPPVHLSVDMSADPNLPITEVVLPSHLSGVDPSEYLAVATQYILSRFGTEDADADYNFDGTVTEEDIYAAMELLEGRQ